MTPTMFEQAAAFGSQLREGARLGASSSIASGSSAVVICGLGGSAAGGRLAAALLSARLRVPVVSVDQPDLPAFVNSDTLAIVCSYSGETRETLDWWRDAGGRGARRVAITSGGTLAREATAAGDALVQVPAGYAPRGALGWLLGAILATLELAGAVGDLGSVIEEMAAAADEAARSHGPASPGEAPRRDAEALAGRPIVFYGAGVRAAAAVRLKNQVNENAKVAAWAGAVPEIAHNEVLGWLGSSRHNVELAVVMLRDESESTHLAALLDAITGLLRDDARILLEWRGEGSTEAARLASLLSYGDYVTCHLGLAEGQDLDDIARLSALKRVGLPRR